MENNEAIWEGYSIVSTNNCGQFNRIQMRCSRNHTVRTNLAEMRKNIQCPDPVCVAAKTYKKRIGSARKKVEEYFGQPEMQNYFFVDVDFFGENAFVDFICPKGHQNRSSFRNILQNNSRCGDQSCVKEKIYKTRIATATKKVENLFAKADMTEYYWVHVHFFKGNSFVEYFCPEGHYNNSSYRHNTRCANFIRNVRKAINSRYKIKTHKWPDGSCSDYMGYEHYLLILLNTKFPRSAIATSLDIILKKDDCRIFNYPFGGMLFQF